MPDVFVSYKAEDRARVRPLVDALQADGLTVWWDAEIGGGEEWREEIAEHLDQAACVIVVWSRRSIGKEGSFVRDEATRALKRGVYLPILIDRVDPPLGFGESQALPLIRWKGNRSDPRYGAILADARAIISGDLCPPHAHVERPRISRRAVVAGGAAAASATAGWFLLKPSSASANSIAVLPFANLSGDPSQVYFSDGIAEEIRAALSRLKQLKVVGRTSSEAVRNEGAETAAKKLGVANIVTGSVRRSTAVVSVSAQLIDGRSGIERWSERYDRASADAIKIQRDIAENVVRALSTGLAGAAEKALTFGGTTNAAAQNLALQAEQATVEYTRAGTLRALELINAALRLDPNYADAYARKSIYLNRLGNTFAMGSAELARIRVESLQVAKKAVALAPNLGKAHFALAWTYQAILEIPRASAEYSQALQLAPGDGSFHGRCSYFTSCIGNPSESLRLADKAIELDPLNPQSYGYRVNALFHARRYQEAIQFAEEATRRDPDLVGWAVVLGNCYQLLGKFREAQQQYSLGRTDQLERITGEALLLARTGDRGRAQGKLQHMQQLFGDAASYQYGEIHAQLGDMERAVVALERAWAIRTAGLLAMRIDAFLDPLRRNPRFAAIEAKLNFP